MDHTDDKGEKALPPGMAISWGMIKQPRRGPKRELSIRQIVDAAIAIADQDGISAVSMNRVSSALGFTAMSLYRYIPSKDDLLILMQDAICEFAVPPEKEGEDWRGCMREFVRVTIRAFVEHPWFGDLPISGVPLTPNMLEIVDWALRGMRKLSLNDYEKMSIVLLLSSYARASGIIQRDALRAKQSGVSPNGFSGLDYGGTLKQLVTPERFPYLHPVLMSGAYTDENADENPVGNDFDFGLERILDGIESYLSSKRSIQDRV